MNNQKTINRIAKEVKRTLKDVGAGHDWWHVYRTWKMAKYIGKKESVNMFVVELSALLHDENIEQLFFPRLSASTKP